VRITTRSTSASAIVRGAPGRGSSYRPSSRARTKRLRHFPMVCARVCSLRATTVLANPSPHSKMIRARRARFGRVRARVASDSKLSRSASVNTSEAFGRPVRMRSLLVEQARKGRHLFRFLQGQDTSVLTVLAAPLGQPLDGGAGPMRDAAHPQGALSSHQVDMLRMLYGAQTAQVIYVA